MMRVLVAGGAGFLGSHVCDEVVRRAHDVVCLDNLITGRRDNVAELRDHPRLAFVEGDAADPPDMAVDLVLHLASPASPVDYRAHPIETMLANSEGTHALLELVRRRGARFVLASTSEVYGEPLEHPQRETYAGNVNPVGPRACYDESKRFAEAMTWEYRRSFGLNASIVRIFNTYGPRMAANDGRVIPEFIAAALDRRPMPVSGDGHQTRSLCYVDDLLRGLLHVAFDRSGDGEIFNIGGDTEMTVLDLAEAVARAAGVPCEIEHRPMGEDDPTRRRADTTRMRERYGWRPLVALPEGLARTIDYFRSLRAARVAEAVR